MGNLPLYVDFAPTWADRATVLKWFESWITSQSNEDVSYSIVATDKRHDLTIRWRENTIASVCIYPYESDMRALRVCVGESGTRSLRNAWRYLSISMYAAGFPLASYAFHVIPSMEILRVEQFLWRVVDDGQPLLRMVPYHRHCQVLESIAEPCRKATTLTNRIQSELAWIIGCNGPELLVGKVKSVDGPWNIEFIGKTSCGWLHSIFWPRTFSKEIYSVAISMGFTDSVRVKPEQNK